MVSKTIFLYNALSNDVKIDIYICIIYMYMYVTLHIHIYINTSIYICNIYDS